MEGPSGERAEANPVPEARVNGDTRSNLASAPRPQPPRHSLALDGLSNGAGGAGLGPNQDDLQQLEVAITDYTEAIRLDPDNAAAYLGYCRAKSDLGRSEEAIADYDWAVGIRGRVNWQTLTRPESGSFCSRIHEPKRPAVRYRSWPGAAARR